MSALLINREVSLDYVTQGRSTGLPVVFLHGYTDSRRSFDRALAHFPDSVYAIAVSQCGHGDSDRPVDGYAPGDFAADIAALLDRLRIDRAVIVGHSMGAIVSQRLALDYPKRVRGLVLVGSFYSIKHHLGVQEFWESTVSKLEDPIDPEIARQFQMSTVSNAVPESFMDTVIRESLKVPARVWKSALRSLLDSDHTHELGNIRVPTLLMWGDQDAYANRNDQDWLLSAIPGSRLSVYAGVGHSPQWEDPSRFATEVSDFVTSAS